MQAFNKDKLETVRKSVEKLSRKFNRSPTTNEIADDTGLTRSSVYRCLKELSARGELSYEDGVLSSRKIDLANEEFRAIPVLGSVHCGVPTMEEEDCRGYIRLPVSMLKKDGEYFALEAVGESMINADIYDGDVVICRQVQHDWECLDGDIVVALTDGENTNLKRMYRRVDGIELMPENPAFDSATYQDITIQGKAVMLLKYI